MHMSTRLLPLLVLITGLMGCQAPFLVFNGGALAGPEAEAASFAFAADYNLLRLEVRPEKPYSVILRVVVHDGQLYIDAAQRRRWHTYLQQDPRVRVRLGDTVYPATAVVVEDPEIRSRFLAGRTIYKIVPRTAAAT